MRIVLSFSRSASRRCSDFLATCLQLPFSALLWRAMLLAAGLSYASASVSAAWHYQRGLEATDFSVKSGEIAFAASLFPAEPSYRRAQGMLPSIQTSAQ
jgi:hypothetical protein